jgi:Protein of unknown function (DUF3604)
MSERLRESENPAKAIQMKGQSESHPSLSPTDNFAAYKSVGPRQPDSDAEVARTLKLARQLRGRVERMSEVNANAA